MSHGGVSTMAIGTVLAIAASTTIAVAQPPAKADEMHRRASGLMQAGQMKEAVAALQDAIREDPEHVDALADLTWIRATAAADELRDPKEAVTLGERMVNSVLVRYNNRFGADARVIQQPWDLPEAARQALGFPQSPGYYRVMIFSTMAAAYAAAGKFRPAVAAAPGRDRAILNGMEPNAEAYGELANEQAEHEARTNPSATNKAMAARTREYLAMYRSSKPLRGAEKP